MLEPLRKFSPIGILRYGKKTNAVAQKTYTTFNPSTLWGHPDIDFSQGGSTCSPTGRREAFQAAHSLIG
jgi:hypothetical protein